MVQMATLKKTASESKFQNRHGTFTVSFYTLNFSGLTGLHQIMASHAITGLRFNEAEARAL